MSVNPHLFIQSVVEAQLHTDHGDPQRKGPGPVVCISRDHGAGGIEIAERLAKRLDIEIYDKEILNAVAREANVDEALMEQLDDRVRRLKDGWIRSLLTGQDVFPEHYRHHLVNVLLGLTQTGGVIMGRGAHVVLANRNVFRLRVIGSQLRCAERVAEKYGMGIEEAEKRVETINHDRAKFVWDIFKRRLGECYHFDLVINTDHLNDWDAVAELVIQAMRVHGNLRGEVQ
ncbi:cytidylate kinase-like family protein [Endothiovibrio diazotrophicus]